jgi:quercetin dioxygenase-like cupin family protein
MKRLSVFVLALGLFVASLGALAEKPAVKAPDHGIFAPADLQWVDAPPSLPSGARMAVLRGDPTQEGVFTIRFKAPDGYRIAPHWHPAFEHVTVISGTFLIGMGEKFEEGKLQAIPAGGFGYMAPGMRHFAGTRGETVVQVHAMGPWQLYYVNSADDPRQAKK